MKVNVAQMKFNLAEMKFDLAQMKFNLTLMKLISCFLLFSYFGIISNFLFLNSYNIVLLLTNNVNIYIYSNPIKDYIFRPNIMRLNIYYGDLIMET